MGNWRRLGWLGGVGSSARVSKERRRDGLRKGRENGRGERENEKETRGENGRQLGWRRELRSLAKVAR